MTTNNRPPIDRCRDENGTLIVRVPLDPKGKRWALLDAVDFDVLPTGLSMSWFMNDDGHGNEYVKAGASGLAGNLVRVARIVLRATPGQRVRFRSRDHGDMRRCNTWLSKDGQAKRDHRQEILDRQKTVLLAARRAAPNLDHRGPVATITITIP